MKLLMFLFPKLLEQQILLYLIKKAFKKDQDYELLKDHTMKDSLTITEGQYMFYYNIENHSTHATEFKSIWWYIFLLKKHSKL
jgi:hypothetical protein